MNTPRIRIAVIDLGYGDGGKGTLIDYLARRHNAHTVVRFNGGSQAGHNVVTPDGRHHTFSSFGSGTFVGAHTHLASPVLVSPLGMQREAQRLESVGVSNPLALMTVHRDCRIVTGFHLAANQLRELALGDRRHGSCGVGIGETMHDDHEHPDDTIYARDLLDAATLTAKLYRVLERKRTELATLIRELATHPQAEVPFNLLTIPNMVDALADAYRSVAQRLTIVDEAFERDLFARKDAILFEGAQGVLIDEHVGFHPHTTWSTCTPKNVRDLFDRVAPEQTSELRITGVTRAYMVRHGAGPLPTEDPELASYLRDAHNVTGPWQGHVRYGWFDAPLLRYAMDACGPIDDIAVTCVDHLEQLPVCRIVRDYDIGEIIPTFSEEALLERQRALGERLGRLRPHAQETSAPGSTTARRIEDHVNAIESELGVPVRLVSHGPTATDKVIRQGL